MEPHRIEGWEQRLDAVISSARDTPYELGVHDCWRVACAAIEALTGTDYWPAFVGKYTTKREALALIAQYGSTWQKAFAAFLAVAPASKLTARRGDLVTYQDDNGTHMGVCLGAVVAVLGEHGLAYIPITDDAVVECWRIG